MSGCFLGGPGVTSLSGWAVLHVATDGPAVVDKVLQGVQRGSIWLREGLFDDTGVCMGSLVWWQGAGVRWRTCASFASTCDKVASVTDAGGLWK